MKTVSGHSVERIQRTSPLFTVEEAAAYLGKSEQWCSRTLRHFVPVVKIGGTPMYRKDDIDRYIQSQVKQPMDIQDVKSSVPLREMIRGKRLRT